MPGVDILARPPAANRLGHRAEKARNGRFNACHRQPSNARPLPGPKATPPERPRPYLGIERRDAPFWTRRYFWPNEVVTHRPSLHPSHTNRPDADR